MERARGLNAESDASVRPCHRLRAAEYIGRRGVEIEAAAEARRSAELAPALAKARSGSAP
jgi:hypothetical protein